MFYLYIERYRNKVGDEGAIALADMVAKNKLSLSALFLGGNFVKNDGAVALANGLKTNNQLKAITHMFQAICHCMSFRFII